MSTENTPATGAQAPRKFSDQSSATPLEKALRVLRHLADRRSGAYFYDDGYPRSVLHDDAAAALDVLAAATAAQPDTARLDWLEDYAFVQMPTRPKGGTSLRDAIDAAMQVMPGKSIAGPAAGATGE